MTRPTPNQPERPEPGAAYLAAVGRAPAGPESTDARLPLACRAQSGAADALETVFGADRLVVIGPPGAGKTALLRAALARAAAAATAGPGRIPVYVDLAQARPGEGVEDLADRTLAALGVPGLTLAALAPGALLLDNLDRATDVYMLEGLELLVRAGGHAGPTVVVACREADWPNYRGWFEGVPTAQLLPLAPEAVRAAVAARLPAPTAAAAEQWLARDRQLADAVRGPRVLTAFLATLRDGSPELWRRGRVLDALLDEILAAVPRAERPAYRAALTDVAVDGVARGALFEVDTVAMGLGVTRDDLIRTGAVVPHGAALAFVEPLLARHCAATALIARASGDPRQLAARIQALPRDRRGDLVVSVYGLAADPVGFLSALLTWDEGVSLAARCLVEPFTADAAGGAGAAALVSELCVRGPALSAATLYRLGEELARLGHDQATVVAVRSALERVGEVGDIDALFNRPDVDAAPPIAAWVRQYMAERNRGLALRGVRDASASAAALVRADEALSLLVADLTFERGLALAAAGDADGACRAFEAAVAAEPDRARYLYHYGRTLVALGHAGDAEQHLQRARDLAPGQADIEAALGQAYRAHDWVEEALSSFEAARALAPHEPAYAQAVGELKAELGDLDAAVAAMSQAVAVQADDAGWHDALGQVLFECGRLPGAARAFARAHALAPENAGYLRRLGRTRLALGDTAAAIDALERARELAPEAAGIWADLGLALATGGRTETAIATLERAVALDESWPADHVWLARLYRETGVLDAALSHARRAVVLAPASAVARSDLGRVHQARGEYREAVAAFNQAAEQAPDDAAAWQGVAAARAALGEGDAAAEARDMAVRLEPRNSANLEQLAGLYAAAGDPGTALEVLQQAVGVAPDRVDYRLRAGHLCLELGRPADAVAHFERAAGLAPDDVAAQQALGRALRAAGADEQALGVLRRVTRLAPSVADHWADVATVALALDRLNEARAAADAALEREPDRADLHAVKGDVEAAAGDPVVAEAAYRQAVELAPDVPAFSVRLADLCQATDADAARQLLERAAVGEGGGEAERRLAALHAAGGEWERACAAYARARALAPEDPDLAAAYGAALCQAGHVEEAVALLESARRAHGQSATVLAQLARTLEAAGRDAEAVTAYAVAADLDDAESALLLRWSRLARRTGDLDAGVEAARRATVAEPRSADAHAALADAYSSLGELEPALAAIRVAASLAPDVAAYRESQARLARELGHYDEAIAALEEGIASGQATARLHFALGSAYGARGWSVEARHAFARAVELEPDNPTYQRALALRTAEADVKGAIEIMRRAVGAAPDDAEALYQLGVLYSRDQDDDAALVQFQRAARMVPGEPVYQRALGECLARLGRPDAAEKLKRSVALNPDDAATHAALGDLYAREGRFAPALDCLAMATRLAPGVAAYWRTLGSLRLARDDAAGAAEALAMAVDLDPNDAESHSTLGIALEQLGRADEAARVLDMAVRLAADDPTSHYRLGRSRLAAGDTAGAIQSLLRAVTLQPRHAQALCCLSDACRRHGSVQEAVQYARAATEAAPDLPQAWRALAAGHRAAGDAAAAATALAHAADAAPGDAATWAEWAAAADAAGDPAAAAAARKAFELAPDRPDLAVQHAEQVVAAGWTVRLAVPEAPPPVAGAADGLGARLEDARRADDPALAIRAARALAQLRGRAGDAAGARDAAEWAAAQDDDPATLLLLAWARLLTGEPAAALESIGLARALGMDGVDVHLLAGRAHLARGEVRLACEAFTRAVESAPHLADAHAALGAARAAQGRNPEAVGAFTTAHALAGGGWCREIGAAAVAGGNAAAARGPLEACAADHPDDAAVWYALGVARADDGDVFGGRAALERAIALAPAEAAWHAELAALARRAGDLTKAREHYREASALEPECVAYRVADAEVALALGLVDEARGAAQAALVTDPVDARALALRGRLALADGEAAAAREWLAQAVERLPGEAELHHWLGLAARADGDRAAARGHLETAAQIDQRAPEIYLKLGELFEADGLVDDAIQAYQQAVVCDALALEPHLRLGQVCLAAGLNEKATAHFQRAAEIAPDDVRPWHALGRAFMASGEADRAVEVLCGAIDRHPGHSELYFDAGQAYKELRDYGRAAEMYRRVMRLAPSNTQAYTQYAAVSAMHFLDRSAERAPAGEESDDHRI